MIKYDIAASAKYSLNKLLLDRAMDDMLAIMEVANQNDPRAIILAADAKTLLYKAYQAMAKHDEYVNGKEY